MNANDQNLNLFGKFWSLANKVSFIEKLPFQNLGMPAPGRLYYIPIKHPTNFYHTLVKYCFCYTLYSSLIK